MCRRQVNRNYKRDIVPDILQQNIFQKMLEDSYNASYIPNPEQVKCFFEYSRELAKACENENIWYRQIQEKALNWLA